MSEHEDNKLLEKWHGQRKLVARLQTQLDTLRQQYERQGAELDAVKLERDEALAREEEVRQVHSIVHADLCREEKRRLIAEAEVVRLREALRFYAQEKHYDEQPPTGIGEDTDPEEVLVDRGWIAREALATTADLSEQAEKGPSCSQCGHGQYEAGGIGCNHPDAGK